ncbi:hypothetical protein E2562_022792 [Oryza meyeriana var. granulata]|uniref:Uncharacterized protein n=1 Tax=Oryza meyeriana var. granulata TaxID=110450 RepID=A0A6G1EY91_9ORYZ|nr:hypothetical protein E2562_022792 [Oryza meyeriana var. granulata]
MAVFGCLTRTDYSLAEVEDLVTGLRRRFEENDVLLCSGSGGPAPGHDLRLYTLSLEVWGAAPTAVAAARARRAHTDRRGAGQERGGGEESYPAGRLPPPTAARRRRR